MITTICNSPPQSGKDEFVGYLAKKHDDIQKLEFKDKLITLTKLIYNVSNEQWNEVYTNQLKDIPSELFYGKTPRNALIYVSEDVIKPKFGKDYFGKYAASCIKDDKHNMFSDGGFYDEMQMVVERCGADNVIILDFKREGCNFSRDSRGFVNIDGVLRFSFDNNGSLAALHNFADAYYELTKNHIPTLEELETIAGMVHTKF